MSKLINLRHNLKQQHHRQLVVISGSSSWHLSQLKDLFSANESVFWVTNQYPEQNNQEHFPAEFKLLGYTELESIRLPYYLGQEIDGAIFNVKEGISADALGIVSGMIKAGGLLIVLAPDIQTWQNLNNPEDRRFLNSPLTLHQAYKHFSHHLINCWQDPQVLWLNEGETVEIEKQTLANKPLNLPTQDQEQVLDKIHHVAFGHRKRPLVISADRGRGKTASFGLAAIDCLIKGKQRIVITASRLDQIKTAFNTAKLALKAVMVNQQEIKIKTKKNDLIEFSYQGQLKTLEYIAPDQLILNPTTADLLMVDEAAHLPTPMLTELLLRHHRMVFSTSLHGYEGSGRGFELRFKQSLEKHTPSWKAIHMNTPIRWAKNDPLEDVIFETLLLKTQILDVDNIVKSGLDKSRLSYQIISSEALLSEPEKLKALFGLLVQAHYQTSPNDLQQLLNAPNTHLAVAQYRTGDNEDSNIIVGVALGVMEGKINPTQKRVHGHLVPQLLTRNYAQDDFLMLSTLRVMRIAVHPNLRRQGIGGQLMQQLEQTAQKHRMDYISSSFGSCGELLPFWFNQHFWPLHVGSKRDKSSGSHNIVVAKPISAMSRQALSIIQTRFQEQFPHLLLESIPYMPSDQVLQIIETFRFKTTNYGLDKAIANYSSGERPYESISIKLWEWSLPSAHKIRQLSLSEQAIWVDKILKKQGWQEVAHRHHLAGRKGVETVLKNMIKAFTSQTRQQNTGRPSFGQPYR